MSPNGLRVLVCKITPEIAKAEPTVNAINILGILISQIIVELTESDFNRSVFNKSPKGNFEGPNTIPKNPPITVNMRIMTVQKTSLFKNGIPSC